MQLNDILEENSIKAITDKTKISEENLEYLLSSNFDKLTKVKTLGFISIIEREYNADLHEIREKALEQYGKSTEHHLFPIGQPIIDDHRGRSNVLLILIFVLLVFSSWYFFTQFDKKHLNELIPFMGEQNTLSVSANANAQEIKEANVAADLSLDNSVIDVPSHLDSLDNTTEQDANITDDNATQDIS